MVRRRRFKAAYLLGSLLLLAASLHPPTAYSAPGDPPSGSPAGAVYQLPLEQGRSDAAPKGGGGTAAEVGGGGNGTAGGGAAGGGGGSGTRGGAAGAGGEAGESSSLYRSENDFGSSSRVPGVAAGTGPGAAGSGGQSAGGAGAAAGSAAIGGGIVAAETADTGNTSIPASILLLAAIAVVAIAVGILSRRYSRRV